MKSKKIIVTGGAGFIGCNLIKKLNQLGFEDILIVDNLGENDKWKNLVELKFSNYLHKSAFLTMLEDKATWKDVVCVFHLGACSSTTERNAEYLMSNNFHYSCQLALAALKNNVRFIYASSAATYGLGELGYDDDHDQLDKLKPLNMYGYSKLLFDLWAKKNNLLEKICGIKFFNVYGPNETHKGAMSSLIPRAREQLLTTGSIKLFRSINDRFKDGEQVRDFVYVKDCVDVLIWLFNNPSVNGIFNLGTGKAQSWIELAGAVAKALNKDLKIDFIPMPDHLKSQYQDFTEANMDKLKKAGCNIRFRNLEEGVKDYFQHC